MQVQDVILARLSARKKHFDGNGCLVKPIYSFLGVRKIINFNFLFFILFIIIFFQITANTDMCLTSLSTLDSFALFA